MSNKVSLIIEYESVEAVLVECDSPGVVVNQRVCQLWRQAYRFRGMGKSASKVKNRVTSCVFLITGDSVETVLVEYKPPEFFLKAWKRRISSTACILQCRRNQEDADSLLDHSKDSVSVESDFIIDIVKVENRVTSSIFRSRNVVDNFLEDDERFEPEFDETSLHSWEPKSAYLLRPIDSTPDWLVPPYWVPVVSRWERLWRMIICQPPSGKLVTAFQLQNAALRNLPYYASSEKWGFTVLSFCHDVRPSSEAINRKFEKRKFRVLSTVRVEGCDKSPSLVEGDAPSSHNQQRGSTGVPIVNLNTQTLLNFFQFSFYTCAITLREHMRSILTRSCLDCLVFVLAFYSLRPRCVLASKEQSPTLWNRLFKPKKSDETMGQAVRTLKYDRAANVANALPALEFMGVPLQWHRLDDGVMGGRSETVHGNDKAGLHFAGTINTDGGGFTSVRAPLPDSGLPKETKAIRLVFRGDGKTYKLTLSDGQASTGGPFARSPSWQADLPTENRIDSDDWQEATIPLSSLKPAFGGRSASRPSEDDKSKYNFDGTEMRLIGLMLSLRLSDGSPNPKETFGEGIFPFSLFVKSIEPVMNEQTEE